MVGNLPEILAGKEFRGPPGDPAGGRPPLLVFNNSRVRKARLRGLSCTAEDRDGAAVEFLLVDRIDPRTWKTLVKRTKRRRAGSRYRFGGGLEGEIVEGPGGKPEGEFRFLRFDSPVDDAWLDIHGRVPLPPYISREDESADALRYQTIYADPAAGAALGPGASAAAPTAGLHFTRELFARLEAAGIESAFITLHVGLGTFMPVRSEHIEDHRMHRESYCISRETARRINGAKAQGRKIIAVGTTSLRALESAWGPGGLRSGGGRTALFVYPGYRFRVVDALFTNFHTPGSTLLMLTAAFAGAGCGASPGGGKAPGGEALHGRLLILESYAEAIREGYRFFSYGDAMLMV
jgi:S-adenosylmethionine:tRNA ribosyltransferase-isomerase